MFKNYIIIALRHFWANKTYVIVNIVGLAIAIDICIIAYFHLAFNFQFNDVYKESARNVYRIDILGTSEDGNKYEGGSVPFPLIKSLFQETPEVKQRIRYYEDYQYGKVKIKDNYYRGYVAYADSGFFQLFKHKFIYGNEAAFTRSSIILRKACAKRYFGDRNPLGETVSYFLKGERRSFVVTGVVEFTENSMFDFHNLVRIENLPPDENDWKAYIKPEVYIEVPEKKDLPFVQKQLSGYVKTYNEFNTNNSVDSFKLADLKEITDRSSKVGDRYTRSKFGEGYTLLITGMALLILLIACFNYTNTSIALAGTRIKEVSLRKVMGSQRIHIITQFFLEHFMIALLAVMLSLVLSQFITSFYMNIYNSDPEGYLFDFSSYTYIIPYLILLIILITIISGAYPAFYISKLQTSDALRKNLKLKTGNWITHMLLTIQLIITVIGLGMGLVFVDNINYINNVEKGYFIENIIAIAMNADDKDKDFELFKSRISENPDILDIGGTTQHIGWWSWIEKTKHKEKEYDAIMLPIANNYLQTMGIKLKQGRFFKDNDYSDTGNAILNEKYVKTAGISNPLNESVMIYGRPFRIIGVVADFMQRGATQEIKPMVITFKRGYTKNDYVVMVVKTTWGKTAKVNQYLEKKWDEVFTRPYESFLQNSTVKRDTAFYERMRSIFLFVSIVSLLLTLIGLFILISLIINKKTKEIGIRKVMGSPIQNIIFILSKNFIYIFLIATLAGSLLGVLMTRLTLDHIFTIDKHLDATPVPFLLASLIIILLTACTISYKVFIAANANPVISLKSE